MGVAPAWPNVTSDGGYLTFFEGVVEALETGVPRDEENSAADARKLVISNLCCLALGLDLRHVVETMPAGFHRFSWGEVRPIMAAL